MPTARILLVEDVPEMQLWLQQVLEGLGYSVRTAHQLWEARVEWTRHRPHLVLLDEILPGESALDGLAELKELGIPVLLMSGSAENRTEPLPEGVLGRWVKPSAPRQERSAESKLLEFLKRIRVDG